MLAWKLKGVRHFYAVPTARYYHRLRGDCVSFMDSIGTSEGEGVTRTLKTISVIVEVLCDCLENDVRRVTAHNDVGRWSGGLG